MKAVTTCSTLVTKKLFPRIMVDKRDGMVFIAQGMGEDDEYKITVIDAGACTLSHFQIGLRAELQRSDHIVDFTGETTLANG